MHSTIVPLKRNMPDYWNSRIGISRSGSWNMSVLPFFNKCLQIIWALAENAAYTPNEAFFDFLNEKRNELDQGNILVKGQRELKFLNVLAHDLRRHGPNSAYIKIRLCGWKKICNTVKVVYQCFTFFFINMGNHHVWDFRSQIESTSEIHF